MNSPTLMKYLTAILLCLSPGGASPAKAVNSTTVKKIFAHPPRQYSSGPLWVWNDLLTEEQIVSTLRDMAAQHVRQVFVHPRPGLMTPYLSDDWFNLWKIALREAERLDMNVWIYDENSYPSGFAGGFVPDAMPEARGRGLHINEVKKIGQPDDTVVKIFQMTENDYRDVTKQAKAGETLPEARYFVASIRRAGNSPWYGGKCYVDLLHPGVTEKFLSITLEPYRQRFQKHFGKRIPGSFTDEPQLRPAGGLPWTDDLPQAFEKRWGYRLTDHLPGLIRPVGDWKKLRHNYFQLQLELFIQRWGQPYYNYCEKYGLEFTGHYWEHEWPNCIGVPDNMAMYAWHQRPAIDTLMNQYREDTHAQFGNARAVRELASVANQLGRPRTLCEAYGAGGWDLRFEDMKRIGDWLYVLGVNTLNEHLSYITLRGARKRDHPQSFSYHTPWWTAYHVMADYFTRLSLVLSQGQQINQILLIQPTTSAWLYQADPAHRNHLNNIGNQFQQTVLSLERAQIEYDIGCEDIMARHGAVREALLKVGQREYNTVVLPPLTENLNAKTMDLLEQYIKAGGKLFCMGPPPSLVDGSASNRGTEAAARSNWRQIDSSYLVPTLLSVADKSLIFHRNPADKGILFHHRRRLEDGEFLFLVNTSIEHPSSGTISSSARGVEEWKLANADIAPYPFTNNERGADTKFELPPCGSLLLFLTKESRRPFSSPPPSTSILKPAGPVQVRRTQPNVMVLDYVDVTAGGESKKNYYFYKASQFAFAKNGLGRNPWDSAVQFKDELITRTFPPNSGVEATYRFTIEKQVPPRLHLVIERPDLYTITCNGKPVPRPDGWWLDKSFGKIDIAAVAQLGKNTLSIKSSPFTIYHELEPVYLLGDFTLKPGDSGFLIAPEQKIQLGPSWKKQGMPFYADAVSYTQTFDIPQRSGRYLVSLPSWYGSVAQIKVNGRDAGAIVSQPWQRDVTDAIKPGRNRIEVRVIGTLKNTLGPHHAGQTLGAAWPNMFHQGPETGPPPGEKYHTLDYGLFEPFVLKNTTP